MLAISGHTIFFNARLPNLVSVLDAVLLATTVMKDDMLLSDFMGATLGAFSMKVCFMASALLPIIESLVALHVLTTPEDLVALGGLVFSRTLGSAEWERQGQYLPAHQTEWVAAPTQAGRLG